MLLKKTKKFTSLLQNHGNSVKFSPLAEALREAFEDSSVYIVSRKGKLLGFSLPEGFENTPFDASWLDSGRMPEDLNESLLKVGATAIGDEVKKLINQDKGMVIPVVGSGQRVGTLVVIGVEPADEEEAGIIGEFAATTIGMIISHGLEEEEEDEVIERRMARSAIKSLSHSEIVAMQHIFDELEGDEGLLVASRIADQAGITRSVIVNALRKLASANVIESRSLGMKGTYLRILNRELRNELERQRFPYPSGASILKKQA
ncbi:MAG: GTP-sensing pleiotropic transcriptional regulator CodY [Limnochordia bacterium]|jgi:transcriptional pleiotropic repressor